MHPALTSVREFPEELGKHLAEFVMRRIREPNREPQQLTIPTRVVLRESTKRISHVEPVAVPVDPLATVTPRV